jgi:Tol biopolymer transport system component
VAIATATNPYGVTWTDDDTILFGQPQGILRVAAGGGTPEVVITAENGEQMDGPLLMPGGEWVLFSVASSVPSPGVVSTQRRWDSAQIVAHSLRTGERKVLVQGGSDARYVDGYLVYSVGANLFALRFDLRTMRVTSGPVSVAEGLQRASVTASANYGVSRSGTLIYTPSDLSDSSPLAWISRTGQTDVLTTLPPGFYQTPRLSSDGQRLLVVETGDVRIYDLASGRQSRITYDGLAGAYADWVPGNDAVVYSSIRRERGTGTMNIWLHPLDGARPATQLTALEGDLHVDSWAPGGSVLAAHHHRQGTNNTADLVEITTATGGPGAVRSILSKSVLLSDTAFSPDGRYIAFVSDETGRSEIHVRPYSEPGPQMTVSVGGGVEPVWVRSGELFYRRLGDYTMMAVKIQTSPQLVVGPPTELFGGRSFSAGGSRRARYAVTSDGQRFLMNLHLFRSSERTSDESRRRIHIVLNWTEELKRLLPE